MKNKLMFLFTLLFAGQAFAASALVSPKARFLDANGNPLAGGKVYTYQAGTTTPLATYNKAEEISDNLNTNPVILDANGEANIWVKESSYKVVLKNSSDVTQWTVDNFSQKVESAFIADASVTAAKLASNSVTTAKILDANVTTAKIADSSVTTAKIADGAITSAKLEALNYATSSIVIDTSTSSTSMVDITNASATITTTGRPVLITTVGHTSNSDTYWRVTSSSNTSTCAIKAVRDSTDLSIQRLIVGATGATVTDIYVPSGSTTWIDVPTAGAHTYKLQWQVGNASFICAAERMKLYVIEL